MKLSKEDERFVLDGNGTIVFYKNKYAMNIENQTFDEKFEFRNWYLYNALNLTFMRKLRAVYHLWKWL